MTIANLFKDKNIKKIIYAALFVILVCSFIPCMKLRHQSFIEGMASEVSTNESSTESSTESSNEPAQSGISIPVGINVPSALQMKEPSPVEATTENSTCPPCPPCARCPEPSFECKKVPKYQQVMLNDYTKMPRPISSDYSTYAM
tara:strand:+ start:12324 stop:12758 length:435 start_codon:yes stop_codon:yes gene_type:complete